MIIRFRDKPLRPWQTLQSRCGPRFSTDLGYWIELEYWIRILSLNIADASWIFAVTEHHVTRKEPHILIILAYGWTAIYIITQPVILEHCRIRTSGSAWHWYTTSSARTSPISFFRHHPQPNWHPPLHRCFTNRRHDIKFLDPLSMSITWSMPRHAGHAGFARNTLTVTSSLTTSLEWLGDIYLWNTDLPWALWPKASLFLSYILCTLLQWEARIVNRYMGGDTYMDRVQVEVAQVQTRGTSSWDYTGPVQTKRTSGADQS